MSACVFGGGGGGRGGELEEEEGGGSLHFERIILGASPNQA